ncbi:hypothetical protein KFK09_011310 [Dendrobium nobile]|uniref:Uncharacterized protein n=1 Tax=Dendrobium nobile TaxID=94219 RepID=A0A8T3BFD2_DENNO|nr:hypothetical protein KFK09_011310 [Dendrobium nobile]
MHVSYKIFFYRMHVNLYAIYIFLIRHFYSNIERLKLQSKGLQSPSSTIKNLHELDYVLNINEVSHHVNANAIIHEQELGEQNLEEGELGKGSNVDCSFNQVINLEKADVEEGELHHMKEGELLHDNVEEREQELLNSDNVNEFWLDDIFCGTNTREIFKSDFGSTTALETAGALASDIRSTASDIRSETTSYSGFNSVADLDTGFGSAIVSVAFSSINCDNRLNLLAFNKANDGSEFISYFFASSVAHISKRTFVDLTS